MTVVVEDPRWVARIVAELDNMLRMLRELERLMCSEFDYAGKKCRNSELGWSSELFTVYSHIETATRILEKLREDYYGRLVEAMVKECAVKRANELVEAKRGVADDG